jgi:hypothetical protein
VPYFAETWPCRRGVHGGIAALRDTPSICSRPTTTAPTPPTPPCRGATRNWGEFRVPSLRNVARTAPTCTTAAWPRCHVVLRLFPRSARNPARRRRHPHHSTCCTLHRGGARPVASWRRSPSDVAFAK